MRDRQAPIRTFVAWDGKTYSTTQPPFKYEKQTFDVS
jgi:hypothetical protein